MERLCGETVMIPWCAQSIYEGVEMMMLSCREMFVSAFLSAPVLTYL